MLIICQIDWCEVGVAFGLQCLRNCTLSSFILLQGYFIKATPTIVKFSTEFQHVTANTRFKVKGSKVKVTAYARDNTD